MNVKIIIVALCAVQLAAGSPGDSVIQGFVTAIQAALNQSQSVIESAQKKYNDAVIELANSAQSTIDSLLQDFKTNIADKFSDALDEASRVPSCLNAQQQNLSAIVEDAGKQILTLGLKEASAVLPLVSKINATISAGRELLDYINSQRKACTGFFITAFACYTRLGTSVAPNVTSIVSDLGTVALQIPAAYNNILTDVTAAISSNIVTVRDKLAAIGTEVENCVRTAPPS